MAESLQHPAATQHLPSVITGGEMHVLMVVMAITAVMTAAHATSGRKFIERRWVLL